MPLLSRNSKMKKSKYRTFNFGIPAYKSLSGFKTCPFASACIKGCYVKAGAYRFSNVISVYEVRLRATKDSNFEEQVIAEVKHFRAQRIRIHDSGDFYNATYLERWIKIANGLPDVLFYAYSKSISIIKTRQALDSWPKNLVIIFSFGGQEDALIDVHRDRHARVFKDMQECRAAGYAPAYRSDDYALGSNIRVGLVYHGSKAYKNTNWERINLN